MLRVPGQNVGEHSVERLVTATGGRATHVEDRSSRLEANREPYGGPAGGQVPVGNPAGRNKGLSASSSHPKHTERQRRRLLHDGVGGGDSPAPHDPRSLDGSNRLPAQPDRQQRYHEARPEVPTPEGEAADPWEQRSEAQSDQKGEFERGHAEVRGSA